VAVDLQVAPRHSFAAEARLREDAHRRRVVEHHRGLDPVQGEVVEPVRDDQLHRLGRHPLAVVVAADEVAEVGVLEHAADDVVERDPADEVLAEDDPERVAAVGDAVGGDLAQLALLRGERQVVGGAARLPRGEVVDVPAAKLEEGGSVGQRQSAQSDPRAGEVGLRPPGQVRRLGGGASQRWAHAWISSSAGSRSWPIEDSRYCTRMGGPGSTSRATTPRASSSFIRSERRRSDSSGTACAISEKRMPPWSRTCRIAPVQRLPISSTASW
jgi:hypothetical protein